MLIIHLLYGTCYLNSASKIPVQISFWNIYIGAHQTRVSASGAQFPMTHHLEINLEPQRVDSTRPKFAMAFENDLIMTTLIYLLNGAESIT